MRNVLLFFLLFCLNLSVGASPVSQEQAFRIVRDFCRRQTLPLMRSLGLQPQSSPVYVCYRKTETTVRSAGSKQVCYYVFNLTDENGFVIVAGDDRARQVLAYSDTGSFEPDRLPLSCAGWLQNYEAEMSELLAQPEARPVSVAGTTRYSSAVVAPMLATRWGQDAPYNLNCPVDGKTGNDARCVVGCTATAVAQIMYYHKYPERPSGSVDYYDTAQELQRFMDFDARPAFDWNNMLPVYDGVSSTEEQQYAVAALMECAGYAARMAYSSVTSIAYHKTAAEAMFTYFGYDRNMRRYERTYLTEQEWTDILTEELQAGRPVFYDGRNTEAGHSFVCDGYDGNGMFHFNWGWRGLADGYYVLSALAPEMQGIGGSSDVYTFAQVMECGIQPASSDSRPQSDPLVLTALYTMDRDYNYNMNGSLVANRTDLYGFYLYCRNIGHTAFSGDLCISIEMEDGMRIVGTPEHVEVPADNSNKGCRWWLHLDGLSEGAYKASFYSRMDGTDDWVKLSAGQRGCSDYTITLNTETVSLVPLTPEVSFRIEDGFSFAPLYAGYAKTVYLPIYNDGEVRIDGPVGVCLKKADDDTILGIFSHRVFCEPGERVEVPLSLNLSGYKAGDYLLVPVCCASAGWNAVLSESNLLPVGDTISVTVASMPQIIVEGGAEGYVLDKKTGALSVTLFQPSSLRPWSGRVVARVYKKSNISGGQSEDTGLRLYSEEVEMLRPSTKSCMLYAEDVNLSVGDDYEIIFYLDNGYDIPLSIGSLSVIDTGMGVREQMLPGLTLTWDAGRSELRIVSDSPIADVSLFGLSGYKAVGKRCGGNTVETLAVGGLRSGLYLLKTATGKGTDVRKIMIP